MSQDKDQYISHKEKMKSMSQSRRMQLQNNPLFVYEQDNEAREMRIETVTIFPRSYADATQGGHLSFVLPNKGYLSGDSRVVLPATCVDKGYQYPINAGVFALIESATMSTATSGVIAQVDQAGELYAILNQLKPAEVKDRIDSVIHGVNFSFETASGSKLNSQENDMESLGGQYRLVCDDYVENKPSAVLKGYNNEPAYVMNGSPYFTLSTEYKDTETVAGSPEFSISLDDLFPGLFKNNFRLPLGLIREEVVIDITLSKDGELGDNDRAIFCPGISSKASSSVLNIGVIQSGKSTSSDGYYVSNATNMDADSPGTGLRVGYTLENGYPQDCMVVDSGSGYVGISAYFKVDTNGFGVDADHPEFRFSVGFKFVEAIDQENLPIYTGGLGYEINEIYTITPPDQPVGNAFKVRCKGTTTTIDQISNIANSTTNWTEGDKLLIIKDDGVRGYGTATTVSGGELTAITLNGRGINYTAGEAQVRKVGDNSVNATCDITVGVGMSVCELIDVNENNRLSLPPWYLGDGNEISTPYPQPYDVTNGAQVYIASRIITVDCDTHTGSEQILVVGDYLIGDNNTRAMYVVLSVREEGGTYFPTRLGSVGDVPVTEGQILTHKLGDDWFDYGCTVQQVTIDSSRISDNGLGNDPIYNYNNGGRKIEVQAAQCHIATDLIFYQDGTEERDAQQMMNPQGKGLVNVFTQYRNIKTTLESDNSVFDYGQVSSSQHSRLVGLSNEVLRNVFFNMYPTGNVSGSQYETHEYFEKPKFNQLMNKYCSRASLNKNGIRFNVSVNSVPYYSNRVETDLRMWAETSKCFQTSLYINKGLYIGHNQVRQLDNPTKNTVMDDDEPTQQPGFSKLDDRNVVTRKYEINDRKAAIVNQCYLGVNQKCMRAMGHLNGVSFMKTQQNAPYNGILVGSTPIDLQIEYDETYDPMFSGNSMLSVYGEVERLFVLKNGEIMVQSIVA